MVRDAARPIEERIDPDTGNPVGLILLNHQAPLFYCILLYRLIPI
jgi:hypothetical protein